MYEHCMSHINFITAVQCLSSIYWISVFLTVESFFPNQIIVLLHVKQKHYTF